MDKQEVDCKPSVDLQKQV